MAAAAWTARPRWPRSCACGYLDSTGSSGSSWTVCGPGSGKLPWAGVCCLHSDCSCHAAASAVGSKCSSVSHFVGVGADAGVRSVLLFVLEVLADFCLALGTVAGVGGNRD